MSVSPLPPFFSQFECAESCDAELHFRYIEGKVLRRTPFIKFVGVLVFFFPLDTDTLQVLLYYKVFHHFQILCQITMHKKNEKNFYDCLILSMDTAVFGQLEAISYRVWRELCYASSTLN